MKIYKWLTIVCSVILLSMLLACNSGNNTNGDNNSTAINNKTEQANQNSTTYQTPLPALAEVLQSCEKIEYVLYDFGITFESQSNNEVLRFFNYILDKPADETNCTKNKHDGSVVFKNTNGDIVLGMEFNVIKNCKRVVFTLDNKTYSQQMSEEGVAFFAQIVQMRNQGG